MTQINAVRISQPKFECIVTERGHYYVYIKSCGEILWSMIPDGLTPDGVDMFLHITKPNWEKPKKGLLADNACIHALNKRFKVEAKVVSTIILAQTPAAKNRLNKILANWKQIADMDSPSELATKIGKRIFEIGNEPDAPCSRIQFMSKGKGGTEKAQGGLCLSSLVREIELLLREEADKAVALKRDLQTVIRVARRNLERPHGTIETIARKHGISSQ
jgi:hypothetical protein